MPRLLRPVQAPGSASPPRNRSPAAATPSLGRALLAASWACWAAATLRQEAVARDLADLRRQLVVVGEAVGARRWVRAFLGRQRPGQPPLLRLELGLPPLDKHPPRLARLPWRLGLPQQRQIAPPRLARQPQPS